MIESKFNNHMQFPSLHIFNVIKCQNMLLSSYLPDLSCPVIVIHNFMTGSLNIQVAIWNSILSCNHKSYRTTMSHRISSCLLGGVWGESPCLYYHLYRELNPMKMAGLSTMIAQWNNPEHKHDMESFMIPVKSNKG